MLPHSCLSNNRGLGCSGGHRRGGRGVRGGVLPLTLLRSECNKDGQVGYSVRRATDPLTTEEMDVTITVGEELEAV